MAVQVGARGQQLQYDGDWVRGRREGQGICYYYNDETYKGTSMLWFLICLNMHKF